MKPFYIGGIDGDSRGLCIQQDGDFEDLGRVGLATSAAANILSKTRLIDAGNTVTYDAHADVYHLHGSERSYVFSRKLNSNGSRSSHYACDMARPAHTDILIATVADKMRHYTKREVHQATTYGSFSACIISGDDWYARHRSSELQCYQARCSQR